MVAAALAGCALRLAFGLFYWNDKPLTHDEREYLSLAGQPGGRPRLRLRRRRSTPAPAAAVRPRAGVSAVSRGHRRRTRRRPPARRCAVKVAQSMLGATGVWIIGLIALPRRRRARRASSRPWLARRLSAARLAAVVRAQRNAVFDGGARLGARAAATPTRRRRATAPRPCARRLAGLLAGVGRSGPPGHALLPAARRALAGGDAPLPAGARARRRRAAGDRAVDRAERPRLRSLRARSRPKAA